MKTINTASEAALKASGVKWLKTLDHCRVTNIAAGPYGENGIVDTHVNLRGFNIWIEWKKPGRDCDNFVPRDGREHLQLRFLESQIAAGGFGFFCSDPAKLKDRINEINRYVDIVLNGYNTLDEYMEQIYTFNLEDK